MEHNHILSRQKQKIKKTKVDITTKFIYKKGLQFSVFLFFFITMLKKLYKIQYSGPAMEEMDIMSSGSSHKWP